MNKTKTEYFLSESQRKRVAQKIFAFGSKQLYLVLVLLIIIASVSAVAILQKSPESNAQTASGPSLTYLDNGVNALVNGENKTLVKDIRGDGTITTVSGGVRYTSNSGERSEHYIGSHTKPIWSDNSSGWFAFDLTIHDTDSSWRVLEQEHEGDMSPTRALEAGGSTLKLTSRYGTPHTRGPDKSWTIKTITPNQRIQVVGYEKFGQGSAVMQAWWRPYGQESWTQFANSTNFSMGYTSGNAGRYHKRGTYHGNHNESSSVTWYGTSVMHGTRASAEAAAGITPSSIPQPTPTPIPIPTPTPTPSPTTQSPYNSRITIPGKLEAENYDRGGQKVAYNDTTTTNQGGKYREDAVDIENSSEGGYSIGWVTAGEWLEYSVDITQSGKYDITFRVATNSESGVWRLKEGNSTISSINIPSTGGWYNWRDVRVKDVPLSAGNNVFRLEAGSSTANLNHVTFAKQASTTTPTPNPPPIVVPRPPQPLPPITIPDSNPDNPVSIPEEVVAEEDGTIVADFNGDGFNDITQDTNNDGQIDPNTEILIDGSTNQGLTDITQYPVTPNEYNSLISGVETPTYYQDDNTLTIKAGPLPETKVSKPVAYTFVVMQSVAAFGLASYLAITKISIFAGIRGKIGI